MFQSLFSSLISNIVFFVLHAVPSSSFPKPLSSKEEKLYLNRLKQGDENAKNILIEKNLRLVAHIIKKYYSSTKDPDDLVSIGTIGLIKAVNTYDLNKGIRLSSYAARCIENEILMFFRGNKKTSQDVSMEEPIDVDKEGNALTLMDTMSVEDDIVDNIDTKIKAQKLKRYVSEIKDPREKNIIILRYGLNGKAPLTQKNVAKILGISRSYVSRIEKKALNNLKKRFKN